MRKTRPEAWRRRYTHRARTIPALPVDSGELVARLTEVGLHPETSPRLTGGDLDADWQNAYASGEEAVGGSIATPDQDVVDEIGRALGVEQADEAELRTSGEILQDRDRLRWHLECDAEDLADGRPPPRRRGTR
jgi:hypothetical protein